jgi:uncharacterized protein (TIGR00162 family)
MNVERVMWKRGKVPTVKDGVLIVGLPGIGLIGQVSCRYMIDKMKAKRVAELFSAYFPHQLLMMENGKIKPPSYQFFYTNNNGKDLFFLVGDVQPVNEEGQFVLAHEVLRYMVQRGVKTVISIGGYGSGVLKKDRKVFGLVTHLNLKKELKRLGVEFGKAKGTIVGAAGMLPGFAPLYKMKGVSLLGETHGGFLDVKASLNVLKVLKQYLDVELDLADLEKEASADEEVLKRIEEEIKKNMVIPPKRDDKEVSSYIR